MIRRRCFSILLAIAFGAAAFAPLVATTVAQKNLPPVPKFPRKSPDSFRIPDKLSLAEAKAAIETLAKDHRVYRQAESISRIGGAVSASDIPALTAYCDALTDRQLKTAI